MVELHWCLCLRICCVAGRKLETDGGHSPTPDLFLHSLHRGRRVVARCDSFLFSERLCSCPLSILPVQPTLLFLCPEFWKNSAAGLTRVLLEGYVRFLRVSRLQDRGIAARTGTHSEGLKGAELRTLAFTISKHYLQYLRNVVGSRDKRRAELHPHWQMKGRRP